MLPARPDDPRLVEHVCLWKGEWEEVRAGRPVLVGFPHDEGVRRNQGRVGAAGAPAAVRAWLYRLTPMDHETGSDLRRLGLLDLGDVAPDAGLEQAQQALGEVLAEVLRRGAIPLVVGGGHETAYGHYLGYAAAGLDVGVLNIDAHLDVRPLIDGQGHSGSPFRQMRSHPDRPLPGKRYACLGAQPFAVSGDHLAFVLDGGGMVLWASDAEEGLHEAFEQARERLGAPACPLYVSLDADVVRAGDVPGVSAPNPLGLSGAEVARWMYDVGACADVRSFELVEINPRLDLDDRSSRWAAVVLWHFLAGLAAR